ncbi:LamG domain-containing protein [Micromonospora auratinigra]|uniref:LamG domain-containing protein n=1 Tax=Micromonospora auratinigra TaxID=261654 RepID=UPI0012FD025B|nr:LamG-like jellyroll fold domain-containing protein [Micromonospora auratinigra]
MLVLGIGLPVAAGPAWAAPSPDRGGSTTAGTTGATGSTGVLGSSGRDPLAGPETEAAAKAARGAGKPVEVLARRTERERLLANPDGSWTTEISAVPVRVRRSDGSWTPVDTTLRRVGDTVTPTALGMDVRFPAGGAGQAARVAWGGREISLGLPWSLPEPVLAGAEATYREVLPGVDLVLTALPEGFSEVLVVRDRAAAANPALAALRFPMAATGATLRSRGGGFVAVDAAGREVFASPSPRMWDSSGDRATSRQRAAVGSSARRPGAPVAGDRQAEMSLSVAGDALTLAPDVSMLADPATVFPVYVDPSVSGTRNEWAMISSGFPDQEYYKFSGDEGMGLCDVQTESTCSRDQIKRLVWEFGIPSTVRGSHVLEATFKAYETSAYDCTADAVQLWRTNSISSATNWSNHSGGWSQQLSSVTVARKSGCSLGAGWVEFNATTGADQAADGSWSTLTLGLKAGSESSMPGGWKRFRYDAALSITFNRAPAVPTSLSVEGAGCATGTARPVLSSATPTMRAKVTDPDPETDLKAAFRWERWSGSAWSALGSGTQSGLTSGGTGQYKIASGLVDKGVYRWQVQAQDPWSYEGSSGTDSSAYSGFCEFELDLVGPTVAPGVVSTVYGTDLNQFYGAVGLTANFTFTASGVGDVSGYRWGWSDPPTTLVTAPSLGASVTLALTPPPPKPEDPTSGGLTTLYVVSVDRTGRASPMEPYVFNLGSATPEVGRWRMNEPAGSVSLGDSNTVGGQRALTLSNGTAGVPGRVLDGPSAAGPTAVRFNGTTASATTAAPVLDTSKSFTVSAWAKLNTLSVNQAVLCQDAVYNCGFALEYISGTGWVLDMYGADQSSPVVIRASSAKAVVGKWTHLVGVYDAGTRQTRLYVNGVLAGSAAHAGAWNTTKNMIVGRARYNSTANNWFNGDIADVRVWNRVVSAPELAPMAADLAGRWRLDAGEFDSAPYGRDLTNNNGVAWIEDRYGVPDSAATFNGTNQFLVSAGPAVRTDQSFTVAGWVRWTGGGGARTALAQDGVTISGFYLGCRTDTTSYWSLLTRSADGTSSSPAYANGGTCVDGDWVHVAAVRDVVAGQVRLYLDGTLVSTTNTTFPDWQANGGFTVGRARWSGVLADFWTGDIDDVRAYAGALPGSEIAKLAG